MIALSVLLACLLGVAALVGLTVLASAITFGLFAIAPHLQHSFLNVEITVRKWRLPEKQWREEQPFAVSICVHPLRNTEYLVGITRDGGIHKVVFSADKSRAIVLRDMLALKAWCWTLEERHGVDAFVVVPFKLKRRKP